MGRRHGCFSLITKLNGTYQLLIIFVCFIYFQTHFPALFESSSFLFYNPVNIHFIAGFTVVLLRSSTLSFEQIIVHPLKQLFSNRGTAAHSGSVVMQVLAISSVAKGHLVKHVLVHPLKHSPSLTGTEAHSGSVVMQVLAISSVTKGHPKQQHATSLTPITDRTKNILKIILDRKSVV